MNIFGFTEKEVLMKHYMAAGMILLMTVAGISACKEEKYVHVGPKWDALHKLTPPEDTFQVRVSGNVKAKLGENLSFRITSGKDGKLWIVQVDPQDELTLLFPNENVSDNTISARKSLSVPPRGAEWSIEASEPAGRSVVAFVITTGPIDIRDVLSEKKDISKALRLVNESGEWGIGKLVIDIGD